MRTSTEWPLTYVRDRPKSLVSPMKIITFVSLPPSNRRFMFLNSSVSQSSVLQEAMGSDVQSSDSKLVDSEQRKKMMLLDDKGLNVFLRGLCKDHQTETFAFEYYQKAKKDRPEFRPDKLTLKHLIRYMTRRKEWNSIYLLSQDFKGFGLFPDSVTCSRLVGSCIRARKLKIGEHLLKIFASEDEIAAHAFISAMEGYNKLHMYKSTIIVYNRMSSTGISADSACCLQIMEAYYKTGDTEKVLSLFNEFQSKNLPDSSLFLTRIYTVLCDSLGKSGRAFEALNLFREMGVKGLKEDSSIYASLICSFASIQEIKLAEELFEEAKGKRMVKDPAMFLKLVLMYVEEGLMEKTLDVVKSMKEQNIRVSDCITCAVINGYSKKRGLGAAANVYKDLVSAGVEPGQVTYASIINIYCRLGQYNKAEKVFSEMENKGFLKCVVAYSSMVSMYGKNGRVRDAMRLLAKMKERGCQPNVWIYNALMDMHGKDKNLRQVEKLWKEMKRRKITPDKISYTSIISAYSKAREFDGCLKFYEEYRTNGGVIDRAMAGILVGVFSKNSRVDELVKLLQDMRAEGTVLDIRLYRSAMNALRDSGLENQAKRFEENLGLVCLPKNEPGQSVELAYKDISGI